MRQEIGLEQLFLDVMKKEIGNVGIQRLQLRLTQKYGTTIRQEIQNFYKIQDILEEQFARGSVTIVKNYIKQTCKSKPSIPQEERIIEDQKTVQNIMNIIGDNEVRKMMSCWMTETRTLKSVMRNCNISQTGAYRKIERMIKIGIIVENGFILAKKTRRSIPTYTTPFDRILVDIDKNKFIIIKFIPKLNLKLKEEILTPFLV